MKPFSLLFFLFFWYCSFSQEVVSHNLEVHFQGNPLKINKIVQDESGFLWLGTTTGIFKFDGNIAEPVGENLVKFAGRNISALALESDLLYAGFSSGGFVKFDLQTTEIILSDTTGTAPVLDFLSIKEKLFVATYGNGILVMEENSPGKPISVLTGLNDNFVYDLHFSRADGLVYAATDRGINGFDVVTQEIISSITSSDGLSDNMVISLNEMDENLLIGTQTGGLFVKDPKGNVFPIHEYFESAIINLHVEEDEIWAATGDGQVFGLEITPGTDPLISRAWKGESGNRITDLLQGRSGDIFIANGTSTLTILSRQFSIFRSMDDLPLDDISAISNGCDKLFFARKNEIFELDHETRSVNKIADLHFRQKGAKVISLHVQDCKRLWIGTFEEGAFSIDLNTKKIETFDEESGILNNNILSISSYNDTIWMASFGGLVRIIDAGNEPKIENFGQESILGSNYVFTVEAGPGLLWVGTDGKGLIKYSEGEFKFPKNQPDDVRSVYSMAKKGDSLFISTEEKEVFLFTNEGFSEKILSTTTDIYSIAVNTKGNLVAFTNGGLISMDPAAKNNVVKEDFGAGFTTDYLNSITSDPDDHFWVATAEYLLRFKPYSNLKEGNTVFITKVENFDSPVSSENGMDFQYDQNYFGFTYTALNFKNPENQTFQYKLDGFDLQWNQTRERKAVYPRLPPGKYTFRVRAPDGENISEENEAMVTFTIHPPFYKTFWFILLCVLLVISLIYIIVKTREKRLKQKQQAKNDLLTSQFEVLKTQVNPHFLFNSFNTLAAVIGTEPNKAIVYVETLSEYFRIILEQRQKDLIRLQEELELARKYIFLQEMRFGKNLKVEIEMEEEYLNSLIPPLTLQMLLENAIKHNVISSSKPLCISISNKGDLLIVKNNLQPKSNLEKSTGIGLENIRRRYEILLNRSIKIQEEETKFEVHLPLIIPQVV